MARLQDPTLTSWHIFAPGQDRTVNCVGQNMFSLVFCSERPQNRLQQILSSWPYYVWRPPTCSGTCACRFPPRNVLHFKCTVVHHVCPLAPCVFALLQGPCAFLVLRGLSSMCFLRRRCKRFWIVWNGGSDSPRPIEIGLEYVRCR